MRIIKPLSICLAVLSAGMLLGGCTLPGNQTVYKYDDPEIADDLVLTKSVYEEGKLTIYLASKMSDDLDVWITSDVDDDAYECKTFSNRIEITGDNLKEVTAICIEDDIYKYDIRYLDTDQYAVLAYIWADDLGWDLVAGDEEDYYTAEELAEFDRRGKEAEERYNANWELIKGRYESDNGNVIELYEDETGERFLKTADEEYPYRVFNVGIYESSVDVLCQDGPLEYRFECELAEDGSYIEAYDRSAGEDVKYFKADK